MFWIEIIVLGISLLVIISLFLKKLGELSQKPVVRVSIGNPTTQSHIWPYVKKKLGVVGNHLWHFILEAKDLRPPATKTFQNQVEKVKNAFRIRIRTSEADPVWLPEAAELATPAVVTRSPEDLYLEAIKKNPNDKHAYEALGRLYLQNKNFADAAQTYEFLIKLDPNQDVYWSNFGLASYSLKEYGKAAHAYEKALGFNSKIATRWINLSLCFDALHDYGKAVRALIQAIELDKLNLNYLMMLAEEYLKIPNSIRAEEVLEQILAIEPTNRQAREKLMRLKI
ncbi:MAG TPA: tetratricopeptide repeat protein [Methylomirabilota bacterium]|nr:tetratricopeptide repeat protein [Methylomirabilota bacterium]